jgi:L-amino acid N-acyltransferase YncA
MSVIPLSRTSHDSARTLTVPVRGGYAALRPLASGEVGPLETVFAGLSPASREARYLVPIQALTRTMRDVLAAVDGEHHLAWLASMDGRPAGIARAVGVAPCTAEIAFEVVDEHHGRGLGTLLVDAVTTAASVSGFRRLQATVHPSNRRSIALLEQVGIRLHHQDGLLEGEGRLGLLDPSHLDRSAVVRLTLAARSAATEPGAAGPDRVWTAGAAAAH